MGTETDSSMISRREILKRGAFVGGAVLWVTPVVQAVGMGRAYAKVTSPNCTRSCIKWDIDVNRPPENPPVTCPDAPAYEIWGNTWTVLGNGVANALTCSGGLQDASIANRRDYEFVVYGSMTAGFWIAFPDDIKLAYLADEGLASVGAKYGTEPVPFDPAPDIELDPCEKDPGGNRYQRIHIPAWGPPDAAKQFGLSHIEMIVDQC